MKPLHRFVLWILLAVIALFAVLAVLVANRTSAMMTATAERTVKGVVKGTTLRIDRLILAVETAVRNYAWAVEEHREDPEYMFRITRQIVENNDFIVGSAVAFEPNFYKEKCRLFAPYSCVSTNGQIRSFPLPYDYPSQEWYREARTCGRACWCEPYFDEGGGGIMMCTYSVPLTNVTGEVYAVLTADISLKRMSEHVSALCPYSESYAVLISRAGRYLVMPPQGCALERDDAAITIREETDNGWTVAIVCPMKTIQEGTRRLVRLILLFAALGLLIILPIAWFYVARLQRESVGVRMGGK